MVPSNSLERSLYVIDAFETVSSALLMLSQEYQLMSIDDNYLSLMENDSGELREDIQVPEGDLGEEIKVGLAFRYIADHI